MIRLLPLMTCFLFAALVGVVSADDAEQYQEIRKLLQEGELSAAEEVFQAAIEENPDSVRLKSLHYLLYAYNNRDENYDVARKHLEAYIATTLMPTEAQPEGNLGSLPNYARGLVSVYEKLEQPQAGAEKFDELLKQVEEIADQNQDNVYAQIAMREMRNRKLLLLAEAGQQDEARISLTTRLSAAEEAVKTQPDDDKSLLDLIFLLKGETELAQELETGDAKEKQEQFLTRLLDAAREHQGNAPLVITALDEQTLAVRLKAYNHPDQAEEKLKKLKEFVESIESENPRVKSRLATTNRSYPNLESAIATGMYFKTLIGQKSFPLEATAWVNGEPLTDADLEGKVVLLDFWAVWCGPCIATFPHLREWQEKYEDKGLVIIGVTSYYNYGWDEEKERPESEEEEITPEEEQAAMLKFAEHHELKHRFMVTPKDAEFKKNYGVRPIPQAVLIDRQGTIRLVRVGSGDENAEVLDALLAELIADGK